MKPLFGVLVLSFGICLFPSVIYAQETFSAVKSANKEKVKPGESLRYYIKVTNTGGVALTNVSITDDISSLVDYLAPGGVVPKNGGSYDLTTHIVSWTLASVASGEEAGVVLDVRIDSGELTSFPVNSISNTAVVNGVNTNTVTTAIIPYPHGNTSPKKGVGLGWDVGTEEQIKVLGASWAYNWGPGNWNLTRLKQRSYEWIPMLHGIPTEAKVASIAAFRKDNNLGHYWLIFNEPDYIHQDNISAEVGARRYKAIRELVKRYEPEAKLIVGGIFYSAPQNALGWLREFRGKYYELYGVWPAVEGWHAHLYKGWSDYNRDEWRQTITYWRDWMTWNGGKVEFWLTEFGSLNSTETAQKIMEDQVRWLENSASWITRYAWFATYANGPGCEGCTGSLTLPDWAGGGLTELGELYATFGNPPPSPTPTPTPAFTLQFTKGWNSLFWQTNFPTNKKPSLLPNVCTIESSNAGTLWRPFVKTYGGDDSLFVADRRYPIWCRETVSWPFN